MDMDDIIDAMLNAGDANTSSIKESEYRNALTNREIWIDTDVSTSNFTLNVVRQIINWNREDKDLPKAKRRPIILYTFSFGGDLDICNAIIDAISCSTTPVYTVNVGRSFSAAAYIYIAGHKRFMTPNAYFLFHQGSATISGSAEEIKKQTELYNEQVAELSEKMKKYTKYPEEEIAQKIKEEWYVRANEAIENGVADKIIKNLDEIIL